MRKSTLIYFLVLLASVAAFVLYDDGGSVTDNIFANITSLLSEKEVTDNSIKSNMVSAVNVKKPWEVNEGLAQTIFDGKPIDKSLWNESNKKIFTEVIARDNYDVLVVPFQNNAFGIDATGRFLMTLYLADAVNQAGLRTPDPEWVTLALGESTRKYDNQEILSLASKLKVKTIIYCYAGHDGNKEAVFKIKSQNMTSDISRVHEFRENFDDVNLPSVIFKRKVNSIVEDLLDVDVNNTIIKEAASVDVKMPLAITFMIRDSNESPLLSAYYLQTMGALSLPSRHRDRLFARSLLAIEKISDNHAKMLPLLKARAYFYLNRRPRALDELKGETGEAQLALKARLNGNLYELEEHSKKISNEVERYIANIELEDLRFKYKNTVDKQAIKGAGVRHLMYRFLLKRVLNHDDVWSVQSNLELKKEMDRELPLQGESAEDLFSRQAALGNWDMENEVDLSVEAHFKKYFAHKHDIICCRKYMWNLNKSDQLFIYRNIGESNLIKKINLKSYVQGLPQHGLDIISKIEPVYDGHPGIMGKKSMALYRLADNAKQEHKKSILQKSYRLAVNVYFWSGGQNNISSKILYYIEENLGLNKDTGYVDTKRMNKMKHFAKIRSLYFEDFPPKWNWRGLDEPVIFYPEGMKRFLELSSSQLSYTSSGFSALQYLYSKLITRNKQDAEELLNQNKHRFIGHPERSIFMVNTALDSTSIDEAIKLLDKAINNEKDIWKLYWKLGNLYIIEGYYDKAEKLYRMFPMFQDADNKDTVKASHYAYNVGSLFYWRGEFDIAKQFYELSANYRTGSGSGFSSRVKLSQLDGDFTEAARTSLQFGNRYNSASAYGDYISYLYIMGYEEPALNAFNALLHKLNSKALWEAAEIGLKKQGKTNNEIIKWIRETLVSPTNDRKGKRLLAEFAFRALSLDRKPYPELGAILRELCTINNNPVCYITVERPEKIERLAKLNKQVPRLMMEVFSNGYNHLRNGSYLQAFDDLHLRDNSLYANTFVLPYLTRASVKAGKTDIVMPYLDKIKNDIATNLRSREKYRFDHELSNAFISAANGDHDLAVNHLTAAFDNRVSTDHRPVVTWYQAVEACEWLYEDYGDERYKELALGWARKYQVAMPKIAWGYAVEARYSEDRQKQKRALAIAMYLDRHSLRIKHFSEAQKNEALKWLENNNPFVEKKDKESKPSLT